MSARRIWQGVKFAKVGVVSTVLSAVNRDLGRRYLVRELSQLPGLGSKMGQLLALKFGKTEWQEFAPEPVPLSWIKAQIEMNAPALARELDEIDTRAALASLGQVHRGRLKSGEDVAIKVRYPQVDEQLEEQLDLVLLAMRNIPKFVGKTLDVDAYADFLREFFKEELDYLHEARSQQVFYTAWSGPGGIVIPRVYPALSTSSVLVQSFEESLPLKEIASLPQAVRSHCGDLLSRFFGQGILQTGLIHTDLHPKNWGYRPDSRELVIYDFGATFQLNSSIVKALRVLARGQSQNPSDALQSYVELGFNRSALEEIRDVLPTLTRKLFEPFHQSNGIDFAVWKVGEEAEQILGDKKWVFRSAGPPWFLMVIRGFNGWLHAMQLLRVNLNLQYLLPESSWSVLESSSTRELEVDSSHSKTKLRVKVMDLNHELVALEFPSRTVMSLEDLIPDSVLAELAQEGFDLNEVKERALRSGLSPQLLFERQVGNRTYRVWID